MRKILSKLRSKVFRSQRPSLYNIDSKLSEYLDFDDGFFIEAGANDGYSQSNTYYLEKSRGWQGILVEGIPELFDKCVAERPNSRVFNCALVAPDFAREKIEMHYAGLMSVVDLSLKTKAAQHDHVKKGVEVQHLDESYSMEVNARTLESVLDEALEVKEIDFFSLDVEGYELNVLRGMNLDKYRPKYILVEARFFDDVNSLLLDKSHTLIKKLSHHDYLYADSLNQEKPTSN